MSLAERAGMDVGWSSRTISDSTSPGEMACLGKKQICVYVARRLLKFLQ